MKDGLKAASPSVRPSSLIVQPFLTDPVAPIFSAAALHASEIKTRYREG
jgi:hypothetical protein